MLLNSTSDSAYFEPKSMEEDMPLLLSAEINKKYAKLETAFYFFFLDTSLSKAKEDSRSERLEKALSDSSFVYGEVTFRSIAYIFEYITHLIGSRVLKGNFYDMGSGVGKGVIAATLCHNFKQFIGIEFLEKIYSTSLVMKTKFEAEFEELQRDNISFLPKYEGVPDIKFINGDFLKEKWIDPSIIFANSTCFTTELMFELGQKADAECPSGCVFITFTKKLHGLGPNWEIKAGFRRLMSWGIATVYIHIKK